MKIHEYQAKELLAAAGADVPRGIVAASPAEAQQAQLFARQCLEDVEAAITRLFERIPEMYVLELVVRDPRSNAVIMSGVVHRDDLLGASHLALEMKLRTVGLKYRLFDRRFESVPSSHAVHEAVAGL